MKYLSISPLVAALLVADVDAAVLRASNSLRTQQLLRHEDSFENVTSDGALSFLMKPIRIIRSGKNKKDDDKVHESDHVVEQGCGVTMKVGSTSKKHDRCPDECPFYAQDRTDTDFCTFRCVKEPDCTDMNPATPIGDKEHGICRSCVVEGCKTCDNSVNVDRCKTCQAGYFLKDDGLCYFKYGGNWVYVVGGALAALVLLVVFWLVEWAFRPTINEGGLSYALKVREAQKLKGKKDENGERSQFPLTTNLMRQQVAGPGMTLHFNFQMFLMVWAVFVAMVWICFSTFVDEDLWTLGTKKFGTPRSNCILVAWGYETQQALMWTKVAFLWIVYIGSFLLCFGYGIYQLRAFQDVDFQHKTMKDFVAMIIGLPGVEGSKNVEEELKSTIETYSNVPMVGVSVAWDFQEYEEEVFKAVKEDVEEIEKQQQEAMSPVRPPPDMNIVRKFFFKLEQSIFGIEPVEEAVSEIHDPQQPLQEENAAAEAKIEDIIESLRTSPRAFAVFKTQEDRDKVVEMTAQLGGFEYEGASGIEMVTFEAEPDTVQWQFFGHSSKSEKAMRIAAGFGVILLACLFWAIVFYSPYAYYVMTFNYENGREPGFIVGFAFSMIVVVGNAIMYEVCAQISDRVGFRFKDEREACYMVLYTIACLFNVALDFVTTYFTAEKVMEGLGFRSYFGEPLSEIDEFTKKFETYGMQRSLAENTYGYAFPSTYLIPFLIEPFPAILAPLMLGSLIVRTHPEVQGIDAAEWVAMVPMEMGRYADLLLNVILGFMIFYFPGGYTWMLFLAMAASHAWIYIFDHYRVLRAIPACVFASYDVEFAAQAMLAPIVGIVAACLVFKSNCEPGMHCLKGPSLIALCCVGWLVHTVLHLVVLQYVIPLFGKHEPEEDPAKDETFETLSHRLPCSWFTANPVHCLRSRHKYKHDPPCSFFILGQEHHMKVNPKIGCYFQEKTNQ